MFPNGKQLTFGADVMWVNTFHYIQDVVQHLRERLLDAACHTTRKPVNGAEDAPADDHRVHVAEVRFSLRAIRYRRVGG